MEQFVSCCNTTAGHLLKVDHGTECCTTETQGNIDRGYPFCLNSMWEYAQFILKHFYRLHCGELQYSN